MLKATQLKVTGLDTSVWTHETGIELMIVIARYFKIAFLKNAEPDCKGPQYSQKTHKNT